MKSHKKKILMAEDDAKDRDLTTLAAIEANLDTPIEFVKDGQELIDYLTSGKELPGLILLDLNMPRKDGRTALKEIKKNPDLKDIPVVVLTTSTSKEDMKETYSSGANSYIKKPSSFSDYIDAIKILGDYWFKIVELPRIDDE